MWSAKKVILSICGERRKGWRSQWWMVVHLTNSFLFYDLPNLNTPLTYPDIISMYNYHEVQLLSGNISLKNVHRSNSFLPDSTFSSCVSMLTWLMEHCGDREKHQNLHRGWRTSAANFVWGNISIAFALRRLTESRGDFIFPPTPNTAKICSKSIIKPPVAHALSSTRPFVCVEVWNCFPGSI